jgi:hypothetical protein
MDGTRMVLAFRLILFSLILAPRHIPQLRFPVRRRLQPCAIKYSMFPAFLSMHKLNTVRDGLRIHM